MRPAATPPWQQSVLPQRTQGSWLDGPSQPGPTKAELMVLRNRTIAPVKGPLRLKPEVATKLLIIDLRDSGYLRVNIQALEPRTQHLYSCAELPFQVFNQLDKEIFRGTLKDNIYLMISKLPQSYPGVTSRHNRLGPRITIQLSQDLVDRGLHARLLAALLHQMIHAYLLQCCGHHNVGVPVAGYDLTHSIGFSSLLYAIQRRFKLPSRFKFPSLWCPKATVLRTPNRRRKLPQEAGSSNCYIHESHISERDCEHWKRKVMDKIPLPPPQRRVNPTSTSTNPSFNSHCLPRLPPSGSPPRIHPPSPCTELHHLSRAYSIPTHLLLRHAPSLAPYLSTSAPHLRCPPTSIISISPHTPDAAFRALYSFLHRGDYEPLAPVPAANKPARPSFCPPSTTASSSRASLLLTHIQTFRLARSPRAPVPELAAHALALLYREPCARDEVSEVVEEVYGKGPGAVEGELRAWVRRALLVEGGEEGRYEDRMAVARRGLRGKAGWGWGWLREDLEGVERERAEREKQRGREREWVRAEKEKAERETAATLPPPPQPPYQYYGYVPGTHYLVPLEPPTPQQQQVPGLGLAMPMPALPAAMSGRFPARIQGGPQARGWRVEGWPQRRVGWPVRADRMGREMGRRELLDLGTGMERVYEVE